MNSELKCIPILRYPFSPAIYPGGRPRFSFLFTRKGIYRVKFRAMRKLLQTRGLPLADERYAILAYGSNACPHQLLKKNLAELPVLFGRLAGAEAVFAARRTQRGYIPATLARKPGTRSSWVTLLTKEQLGLMDRSEGRPNYYVLAEVPLIEFTIGRSRIAPLYSYIDVAGGVMTLAEKPLSLRSTSQKRARSLFASASGENAAKWLDFVTIPDPNPPSKYSTIIER